MSEIPTPPPALKGRRIAALLALAATDAAARDCRDMGPGAGLKMPPPSMWVEPPRDFARVSCEDISENYAAMHGRPLASMERENRDCHLLMSEETLKPCPFCGEQMELRTIALHGSRWMHPWSDSCPANAISIHASNVERIAAWNTRTPPERHENDGNSD